KILEHPIGASDALIELNQHVPRQRAHPNRTGPIDRREKLADVDSFHRRLRPANPYSPARDVHYMKLGRRAHAPLPDAHQSVLSALTTPRRGCSEPRPRRPAQTPP